MASNQTEHLKLCQWEEDDEVLRADFNADNAKIDAAVTEARAAAAEGIEAVRTMARAAYSPNNLPYVVGTYTGDGASTRTIYLGFTPSAVLIADLGFATYTGGYYYSGFAIRNGSKALNGLKVVTGGFQIGMDSNAHSNAKSTFLYIAFK